MLRAIVVALCMLLSGGAFAAKLQALKAGDFAGAWLIRDKEATSLKLNLYILTGERDGVGVEGLAHYVEHLAWENMKKDNAEPRAGHSNAFTSSDLMGYWLSGEPEQAAELLSDLLKVHQPLTVEETFALEEREIIQREYDYRERENWRALAWRGLMRRLHADDPRQRDVGGSPEVISRYSLSEARQLHRQTHNPQNSVLVLQGNLSKNAANKLLRDALGRSQINKKALPRSESTDYRMAAATRDLSTKHYTGVTQPELLYTKLVRLPEALPISDLFAQTELLDRLLSSRLEGGLSVPLHYDNFFANDFSLDISVVDKQHVLMYVEATPDVGVSLQTLLQAVESELSKTAEAGLQNTVVEKIRQRAVEQFLSYDQVRTQSHILQSYLEMRETPVDNKKYLSYLKRSDTDSVVRLLQALAGEGRVVAELVELPEEVSQ